MTENKLIIKNKKLKGEDGYKTFSIRIKDDLASRLDTIAQQSGYSRNELISVFLEYALQNCIIED